MFDFDFDFSPLNPEMTFEQAVKIANNAIRDGRRYAKDMDSETLAGAIRASHNYAIAHTDIILAQTRKIGAKGEHGRHSVLGALIFPQDFFLSWLFSGKALDVLGITDNGCLQVRRLNFDFRDIGVNAAKRPESLVWLPTEYNTYDDIPPVQSDCKGQRARAWELVVTGLIKNYYKDIKRHVSVDWIGGLNNVQYDIRVLDLDTGELSYLEVKGYFGRIAKFIKDKKKKG